MDGEFLVFTSDDKTSIINQSDSQRFRVVYQFVSPSGVSMPQVTYNIFSMWIIHYKKKVSAIIGYCSLDVCFYLLFVSLLFVSLLSFFQVETPCNYSLIKKYTILLNNRTCYTNCERQIQTKEKVATIRKKVNLNDVHTVTQVCCLLL